MKRQCSCWNSIPTLRCMLDSGGVYLFAVKVAGWSEFINSDGEAAKDVKGLFHYGLFQIITSEPPRMSHFQHYPAKRIIFSGHGLAGALDHMFLICYMINNRGEDREHISIGFGSPYFCDNAAKRFCQKTMKLDRRMFTFVNATCGFKDDLQSRVSRKEGRLLLLGKIEYMVGLKKFGWKNGNNYFLAKTSTDYSQRNGRGFWTEMEANLINIWKKDEILGQTHLSVIQNSRHPQLL